VAARTAKRLIQTLMFTAIWLAALFGSAGTFDWTRGWTYAALYVGGMGALGAIIRKTNPDLIEARAKIRRKDTKAFDKVFLAIFLPLTLVQPAVAGLDAVRFHWSSMPDEFLYVGTALLLPAMALIGWTMAVNRYAETTVRIQTDRGHTVVDRGPYRFVRHPMYVGAMVMYVATALILGSFWALAVAGVIVLLFIWRTAMEDLTLRRELAGYEEYAARTRYRLLPGVW
jgi:protein-S-isoprenylcysteine O-methyltransferase Ste14